MRKVPLAVLFYFVFSFSAYAGNPFTPQNYGNDFLRGFSQSQEILNRQRQIDQADEMIRLERERLRLEKERLTTDNSSAAQSTAKEDVLWRRTAYLTEFILKHPEYNSEDSRNKLIETAKILWADKSNTGKSDNEVIQQADRIITWQEFSAAFPEFADANSDHRKYGDYIYDRDYASKVDSGELSYGQALLMTIEDVSKVFPVKNYPPAIREAPAPPPVD